MRLSDTTLFAARMRPRKYDSSLVTGRVSGMSDSVEVAGSLEPCRESSESAGSKFGLWGGGGVRYKESSVW